MFKQKVKPEKTEDSVRYSEILYFHGAMKVSYKADDRTVIIYIIEKPSSFQERNA